MKYQGASVLILTVQPQPAMPTTPDISALAVGLIASAKIVAAARTTESAEFQAVKAEHQETNDIYGCGKLPKNWMQRFVKAKGNQNNKGKAPKKRYECENAEPSMLGPLNREVGHEV